MTFDDLVRKYTSKGILSKRVETGFVIIETYLDDEYWLVYIADSETDACVGADEVLKSWLV